jgi:nucleotide-binding universal stress UspA family protein
MRDILLATDFSEAAEAAFEHALALALSHRADLTLLHAGPEAGTDVPWDSFPHVRETLSRWGRRPEGGDAAGFRKAWGIGVSKRAVRTRHPVNGILETAADLDPEVIVLARRAVQGWGRGSVSAQTARRAAAPVLVVPEGARGFVDPPTGEVRIARVLAAVDRRPDPRPALREARRLAHLGVEAGAVPTTEVELLHVGEASDAPEIPDDLLPAARITRRSMPGDPAEVIAARAEEIDADLILLACEGRSGLLDALFGSTTERVLDRATRPVLAIPAADEEG